MLNVFYLTCYGVPAEGRKTPIRVVLYQFHSFMMVVFKNVLRKRPTTSVQTFISVPKPRPCWRMQLTTEVRNVQMDPGSFWTFVLWLGLNHVWDSSPRQSCRLFRAAGAKSENKRTIGRVKSSLPHFYYRVTSWRPGWGADVMCRPLTRVWPTGESGLCPVFYYMRLILVEGI